MRRVSLQALVAVIFLGTAVNSEAHDGPPYPIVSDHLMGGYRVSVWTDPDTTDDGTAGGQFWIMIDPMRDGQLIPLELLTRVTVHPLDVGGEPRYGLAAPVDGNPARRFVAINMDREGRFRVRVDVERASGSDSVDAEVQATYDLRPSPWMLAVYAVPFVLTGALWIGLLVKRRSTGPRPA